jgi:hypothetical protein
MIDDIFLLFSLLLSHHAVSHADADGDDAVSLSTTTSSSNSTTS